VVRTYPGGRSSTVVNDLMWGVGRFFVLEQGPFVYVDLDRNQRIDFASPRKFDIIPEIVFEAEGATSSWLNYVLFEEALDYGPQLVEYLGSLFSFTVPAGTGTIYYRFYQEPDCDPEYFYCSSDDDNPLCDPIHTESRCGIWASHTYVPLDTDIASDMSVVAPRSEPAQGDIFLFYMDSESRLCVLKSTDPYQAWWQGPACRDFSVVGPPEAVEWGDTILVYATEPREHGSTAPVVVVQIPVESWQDTGSWVSSQAVLHYPNGSVASLRSSVTPAAAFDEVEQRLYLVTADSWYVMHLAKNQAEEVDAFLWQEDSKYWRKAPLSSEYGSQWTDYRPAFRVERADDTARGARWQLWFHGDGRFPGVEKNYWRSTSTFEEHGDNAFTFTRMATMPKLRAREVRNVSLAIFAGKLRAAVAFDAWEEDPEVEGDEVGPGWVFLPVADGVFHGTVRDTNDVEIIGRKMNTTCRGKGLFWGMTGSERNAVFEANHMDPARFSREARRRVVEWQVAKEPEWCTVPHR